MKNTIFTKTIAALTIIFALGFTASAQTSGSDDANSESDGAEVCRGWKTMKYTMFSAEREIYYGCGYYEAGDFELAAMRFREAVGMNAKNATAYFYLANAYAKLGKSEEARAAFKKAVELDSSYQNKIVESSGDKAEEENGGKEKKPNNRADSSSENANKTSQTNSGDALFYADYTCNQWNSTTILGILSLKANGSYTFRGNAGRYTYDKSNGKITWTSGYLSADENTTKFRRNKNTAQIDITFKTTKGNLDWECGTNLK